MRKYLVAAALGLASVGAMAGSITDPVTGLMWLDLEPAGFVEPISSVLSAAPGYEIATSAQVAQFFADEGLTSYYGSISCPTGGQPGPCTYPPGLATLYFEWGADAQVYSGPADFVDFYTTSDSGAPGTVGIGEVEITGSGGGYAVSTGSGNIDYASYVAGIYTPRAAFALVSIPAVPEPSSWALMAGGVLFVAHRRLLRRR